MKKHYTYLLFTMIILWTAGCKKTNNEYSDTSNVNSVQRTISSLAALSSTVTETFETGTKTTYTNATVTLGTGIWTLNDALLGNTTSDAKSGTQSVRLRNSGIVSNNFDFANGASTVTVLHGLYGTDASCTWQLWYSTNGGSTFVQTGSTITTSTTGLQTATFTLNIAGNIRFQLRKTDGTTNRINLDNFTVNPYSVPAANPVLSSIAPSSATAGGGAFTLTAIGSNFINTSVINWNGTALPTTYVNATTLTAAVSASNINAAGSASVTVSTTGATTSSPLTFSIQASAGGKRFLFDATKGETAGNADWVIDEDVSPQRVPTPAQSNVSSSTGETYWTGALSSWGIALVKSGNFVETLPSGTGITYGNSTNPQDLSKYDVFVVDEPNIRFTTAEKVAILKFVNNGGGLFIVSDHTVSDRNNDGWDSPAIWNDFMTNNTLVNNPFGFSIDLSNISQISSNVLTSTTNPIMNGSKGKVTKLQFNNGATLTLQPTVNSNVQGLVWTGTSSQGNTGVMAASSRYGNGRVFVVADSSPVDDGTGATGKALYVGWPLYSHTQLFMNASLWLAKLQ